MQAQNGGAASALHWPPEPRMRTLVPPLHEQYSILAHAANQRVRREQTVSSWTLKWHHHQQSYEGCMEPDLHSDWRWRSGRRCPSKGPRLGARLCGAWRVPRKPRHPPGSSNGCRPPPRWSDEWKAGERGGGPGRRGLRLPRPSIPQYVCQQHLLYRSRLPRFSSAPPSRGAVPVVYSRLSATRACRRDRRPGLSRRGALTCFAAADRFPNHCPSSAGGASFVPLLPAPCRRRRRLSDPIRSLPVATPVGRHHHDGGCRATPSLGRWPSRRGSRPPHPPSPGGLDDHAPVGGPRSGSRPPSLRAHFPAHVRCLLGRHGRHLPVWCPAGGRRRARCGRHRLLQHDTQGGVSGGLATGPGAGRRRKGCVGGATDQRGRGDRRGAHPAARRGVCVGARAA